MAYTAIDDPSAHFQTVLYTGDGSTQSITNGGNSDLQPDWIWIKERSSADDHKSYDSSRGTTKKLSQNDASAEETQSGVTAFNSDGFSLGSHVGSNQSSETYVAWQWKESATAGFDIVLYTGNGSARTLSHSLSAVPHLMIVKTRSKSDGWMIYHHKNTAAPETDFVRLDNTDATTDNANMWNDTAPTSSVFTVGIDGGVNDNTETYIAYIFTSIQGYSKFGSYIGNGNVDGPFIYTGFKPAWLLAKRSNDAGDWILLDNTRNTSNPTYLTLKPNSNAAAITDVYWVVDFLSNGFKVRLTDGEMNGDGETIIYMAFAEQPFVTSGGVPCTAR